MDLDETVTLTLTLQESMTLLASLDSFVREFEAHREEDATASHSEAEWQTFQREVGVLRWRLEELGRSPGSGLLHGEGAVAPPDAPVFEADGWGGVFEPWDPGPGAPESQKREPRNRE